MQAHNLLLRSKSVDVRTSLFACAIHRTRACGSAASTVSARGAATGVQLFPSPKRSTAAAAAPSIGATEAAAARRSGEHERNNSGISLLRVELERAGSLLGPLDSTASTADARSNQRASGEHPRSGSGASTGRGASGATAGNSGATGERTESVRDKPPAGNATSQPQQQEQQQSSAADVGSLSQRIVSAQQVLLAGDLQCLTRKRLLLVVDSDNAAVFQQLAERPLTHAPLMLLSPIRIQCKQSGGDQVCLPFESVNVQVAWY